MAKTKSSLVSSPLLAVLLLLATLASTTNAANTCTDASEDETIALAFSLRVLQDFEHHGACSRGAIDVRVIMAGSTQPTENNVRAII